MPPHYALYRVGPDTPVSLADQDPADTGAQGDADAARAELKDLVDHIADLQARVYAEEERSRSSISSRAGRRAPRARAPR
jgi:hypothetical protein